MDNIQIDKKEYAEFLNYKREKILKSAEIEAAKLLQQIEALSKSSDNSAQNNNNTRRLVTKKAAKRIPNVPAKKGEVGWRQILKDIFTQANRPLFYSEVVEAATKHPALKNVSLTTMQRSITSNLSTYSKGAHERYSQSEVDGKKQYTLKTG